MHSCLHERADLIAHKRYERRDDDRNPGQDDAGDLVAQRLSCACRHDGERIAPGENRLDHAFLSQPEVLVAEAVPQRAAGVIERRRR